MISRNLMSFTPSLRRTHLSRPVLSAPAQRERLRAETESANSPLSSPSPSLSPPVNGEGLERPAGTGPGEVGLSLASWKPGGPRQNCGFARPVPIINGLDFLASGKEEQLLLYRILHYTYFGPGEPPAEVAWTLHDSGLWKSRLHGKKGTRYISVRLEGYPRRLQGHRERSAQPRVLQDTVCRGLQFP